LIVEDEKPLQYYSSRRIRFTAEEYCKRSKWNEANLHEWQWNQGLFCCSSLRCDNVPFHRCTCKSSDYDECLRWYHTGSNEVPGNPRPGIYSDPQETVSDWRYGCYTSKNDTGNRPYGYTAQYTVLRPTLKTLGAPDYYRKNYIKIFQVNCHSPIISDEFYESGNSLKGKIPLSGNRFDTPENKRTVWKRSELYAGNSIRGEAVNTAGGPYKTLTSKLKADPFPEINTKYSDITTADDFSELHSIFTISY